MPRISIALRTGGWLLLSTATAWVGAASDRAFRLREAPTSVLVRTDLPYRVANGQQLALDIYVPADAPPLPVPGSARPAILAIHGGSWIGGSKRLFRPSLREPRPTAIRLAEMGYVVIAADYRLARPGSPSWPDAADDLRDAVRWIRRHADELGIDPDRIAALGQSAGAHLAAVLATPIDESSRLQAVVAFYAPSDLERLPEHRVRPLAHEPVRLFVGGRATAREASPIHRIGPQTAPMLLIHGSRDLWVPIAQTEELADALRAAGIRHELIRVEGARHGFEAAVNEPEERDLLGPILDFLRGVWNASTGR